MNFRDIFSYCWRKLVSQFNCFAIIFYLIGDVRKSPHEKNVFSNRDVEFVKFCVNWFLHDLLIRRWNKINKIPQFLRAVLWFWCLCQCWLPWMQTGHQHIRIRCHIKGYLRLWSMNTSIVSKIVRERNRCNSI